MAAPRHKTARKSGRRGRQGPLQPPMRQAGSSFHFSQTVGRISSGDRKVRTEQTGTTACGESKFSPRVLARVAIADPRRLRYP